MPIKTKSDAEFTSPIEKLKWVMECLRDPENGCPWDREQDFKSIMPYTIEEAYEVADAIERADMDELKGELGDLLLQVIYHAQMGQEEQLFSFDDIAQGVADKIISRHPHVFGDTEADNSADVAEIWEEQKDKENKGKTTGALSTVTKGLPALLRAEKLQKKAAKTGFEWATPEQSFDKVAEEIAEFKDALSGHDDANKEEEFGDLLLALVNYGRMNGLHAEEALRKANNKFEGRFSAMEKSLDKNDKSLADLTLNEMLDLWKSVK